MYNSCLNIHKRCLNGVSNKSSWNYALNDTTYHAFVNIFWFLSYPSTIWIQVRQNSMSYILQMMKCIIFVIKLMKRCLYGDFYTKSSIFMTQFASFFSVSSYFYSFVSYFKSFCINLQSNIIYSPTSGTSPDVPDVPSPTPLPGGSSIL